ncbi:uncharacterized, partial [Tachysurus ichikawai]
GRCVSVFVDQLQSASSPRLLQEEQGDSPETSTSRKVQQSLMRTEI